MGHVTLNLLLIPKFIEDGWKSIILGTKRNRIPRDQKVWLRGYDSIDCNREIASLFLFPKYDGCVQGGLGNAPIHSDSAPVRPQVLFSKGICLGATSDRVARLTRVPVYIHESDLSMGLANKIAYKFATKMYTTFEQAHGLTKSAHIGAVTKVTDHIPTTSEVLEEKKKVPKRLADPLSLSEDQLVRVSLMNL